jgi:membrane-anchored protein YejM (alkaline phosphatase superfamily)
LFYDASNAREYPPAMNHLEGMQAAGSSEPEQAMADYRKSIRFVDSQVAAVLGNLEDSGLSGSTVVIITADHGEEFEESVAGLRDHGSGYTRYQLQVPMVVHWPGKTPQRFDHRTSHFDVVPTLMHDLLGCSNPPGDFSSGRNLYQGVGWEWLLAGSYYNYALLEPDQITITYPDGHFEVRDRDYQIARRPQFRGAVLEAAARENSRFYRR